MCFVHHILTANRYIPQPGCMKRNLPETFLHNHTPLPTIKIQLHSVEFALVDKPHQATGTGTGLGRAPTTAFSGKLFIVESSI